MGAVSSLHLCGREQRNPRVTTLSSRRRLCTVWLLLLLVQVIEYCGMLCMQIQQKSHHISLWQTEMHMWLSSCWIYCQWNQAEFWHSSRAVRKMKESTMVAVIVCGILSITGYLQFARPYMDRRRFRRAEEEVKELYRSKDTVRQKAASQSSETNDGWHLQIIANVIVCLRKIKERKKTVPVVHTRVVVRWCSFILWNV